jgi:hypothetical protein
VLRWTFSTLVVTSAACFPGRYDAAPRDEVPWSDVRDIPDDLLDGDDVGSCDGCITPDGPLDLPAGSTLAGEPIAVVGDPPSWSDLTDIPTGIADGVDDDALGALACDAGSKVVATGSGWACDPSGCPAGTTEVLDACVELDERAPDPWVDAALICDALGRRLCTAQELIVACSRSLLRSANDDAEWASDFFAAGAANGTRVLGSTCTAWTSSAFATPAAFRCCRTVR